MIFLIKLNINKQSIPSILGNKQITRNITTKIIPITLIYTSEETIDLMSLNNQVNIQLRQLIEKISQPNQKNVLDITLIEVIDKSYKEKKDVSNKTLILSSENKDLLSTKIKVIEDFKTKLLIQNDLFPPLVKKELRYFVSKMDHLDTKLKHLYETSSNETFQFPSYKDEIQANIHSLEIEYEENSQFISISSEILYKDFLDKDITKTLLLHKNIIYLTHDTSFYQSIIKKNAETKKETEIKRKNLSKIEKTGDK